MNEDEDVAELRAGVRALLWMVGTLLLLQVVVIAVMLVLLIRVAEIAGVLS